MFRRMYLTISGLLVFSTGLLLILLGVAVYRELQTDLTRDSEHALTMQTSTVQDAARDAVPGKPPDETGLRDNRGDSIFYYAKTDRGIVKSVRYPVPFEVISTHTIAGQFSTISYKGVDYRIYSYIPTDTENDDGSPPPDGQKDAGDHEPPDDNDVHLVYMYTLITQETSMLHHASRLMWTLGGAGFLLALIGDLFLAGRLMRPTYRAWTAYRDTVLELSHELQTPLATVNAMMTSRGVDESTAADVRHEIERASRMVSDMLFLSRLRSGFSEQPMEPVAVSDITEELAERYTAHAAASGLHIAGSAKHGLFVETTPGEWERLVSTLFKNVIDHADHSVPATWQLIGDGRKVKLTMKNTIPKSDDDDSQVRAPERGVGLQIVRRLAGRMRGTVQVRATEYQFEVTVSLPARKPHW